jgi:hypothetical protein
MRRTSKFVPLFLAPLMALTACGAEQPVAGPRGFTPMASAGAGARPPEIIIDPAAVPGGNPEGNILLPPPMAAPATDGTCNQDVDIVFVLDVSGSMIPPLSTLEREVGLVDEALKTKNLPNPPHYGLVIFVDTPQTLNGGMPYADVEALKVELRSQIGVTQQDGARQLNGGPPDNLTWPENALDGLWNAASEFQWRDAAKTLRTIILVTDASFWDITNASSGHMSEINNSGLFPTHVSMHGYDDTIAQVRMQQIWVNTFAAKTGGPPDGMMSPPSHGEWRGTTVDVGVGYFEPYNGKPSLADSTGGAAWDIDDVFDMKISLATPINESIEARQCAVYPQ